MVKWRQQALLGNHTAVVDQSARQARLHIARKPLLCADGRKRKLVDRCVAIDQSQYAGLFINHCNSTITSGLEKLYQSNHSIHPFTLVPSPYRRSPGRKMTFATSCEADYSDAE